MSDTIESLRVDFIKRLFSVAASVGFATQISKQDWLIAGKWPNIAQSEGVVILISSIVVVVASWEGYFNSISLIKLQNRIIFYIDIFIVIEYIILLDVASNQQVWHWVLTTIFLSYFVWDFLTHLASKNLIIEFILHSLWWFLFLLGIAALADYGPFHPFRYTAASLISVVLFRKNFGPGRLSPRNFVIHFVLATLLGLLCFVSRDYFLCCRGPVLSTD